MSVASVAPPNLRKTSGRRISTLAAMLIVVLAILVIPPVIILIQLSVTVDHFAGVSGGLTLSHYATLIQDKRLLSSAANSLIFAVFATAVSLVIGGLVAWLAERTNAPLRGLAYLTTFLSMATPYILYVMGWLFLFGRVGPFNSMYRSITGSDGNLFNVHSMTGMVIIEGFLWSPLVFLMLAATFRSANAEMEEAARTHGASVFDTMRRISMPMAWPAIAAMAMFVFIRNLESFDVPILVGTPGNISLMTTDIYYSVKQVPPDMGHASAFSVVMLVIVAVLMYFYGRISRNAEKYATVTGKGFRPRPFDLGSARWIGGLVYSLYFAIVLLLPILALVWMSLMPFMRPIGLAAAKLATLSNYAKILGDASYVELAINTLTAGAGAATIAMALAAVAGWLAARRKAGGAIIDQLTAVPLVFPGVVLGFAMMEFALRAPFPLYGTVTLMTLAFVIRYIPYAMRYAYSGVLQIHKELEEAAQINGATPNEGFVRVVLPLLMPALAAGWLFVFLLATKELSMSLVLAGPRSQVIAVALYDLSSNGQASELAAFGLTWTAAMMLCAGLLYLLARRRGGGMR